MNSIFGYVNKNRWIIILTLIFIIGIFLRTINFGDSLIFKSDQARDALIMNTVKDGDFSDIPLLGPQIGGTGFRLGPITYYFQYISANIFGFTPESFAYSDLFFGILTIPLLFLLSRKFFSMALSLWITALASVSLMLVTFSRFGWNPNSLPFFTTLFAISFLYALESKGKKRWIYLSITGLCIGIMAQLHLAAILGIGLGLAVFLLIFRLLKWKEIILCVIVISIVNLPVFINEWRTSGENIQQSIRAISKKGSKDSKHAIYEKIFRAYQENARIIWLVAVGQQNTDIILTKGYLIKCDNKCESSLPYSISAMILFGYMIIAGYLVWKNEQNLSKKRAVAFLGLWMGGFFLFSILLAYQLETRFYLSIITPLLIFFGFAIERILNISKNIWVKYSIIIGGVVILFVNFYSTAVYLRELAVSQYSYEESNRDLRFGTAPKVTLGQLREIANKAGSQFNNNAPIIITGESLYVKSLYYVVFAENKRNGCYIRGDNDVSAQFNNLIIEYAPSEKTNEQVGTLSAKFIPAISAGENTTMPKNCLAY